MTCYFVAQIRIHDNKVYEKYLEKADDIFSKYNGEYLAVDDTPTLLEGKWNYTKSVLIKFKSKQDFQEWYYSQDYQEILKYRLKSSSCDTIQIYDT
jgi:uncharacterized protein (DUF1330 family)